MFKGDSLALGLNRRGLLTVGASTAVAALVGSIPSDAAAVAATFNPSPQLHEYRRCKAAWLACFVEPYEEDNAWDARVTETGDAVTAAIAPFLKLSKTPVSWSDIREIAEVFRAEMFYVEEDGDLHKHSSNREIDTMLLRAVLALPAGGANV